MTDRNGSPHERRTPSNARFSLRRWAAVLASCLVPGAGHWIVGRYAKGLLLISAAALDVAAIFKLADAAGGKHLLLIVYLGMALPVLYFYGVFDTLQSTGTARVDEQLDADYGALGAGREEAAAEGEPFRLQHAVFIIIAGMLLLFLLRMPDKLRPWLDAAGDYGAPALLLALTVWIVLRRRESGRYRLGRWSAAILAFGTGALLLSGEWTGKSNIALLGSWWPLLFVTFGGELLVYSLRRRKALTALSADMSAVTAAVIIAVTAYSITQYAELPFRWLDQWAAQRNGYTNFSEEKGFSYDKPAASADVPADLKRIVIDNPNGDVIVKRGNSDQIVVETTVWIDSADRAEADSAAEGTAAELAVGEETSITTTAQGYGEGGERMPRVNVTVSLPPSVTDAVPIEGSAPGGLQQGAAEDQLAGTAAMLQQGQQQGQQQEQQQGQEQAAAAANNNGEQPLTSGDGGAISSHEDEAAAQTSGEPEQQDSEEEEREPLELRIHIQSGDAEVSDIAASAAVTIEVGSGTIAAQRIGGTITAKAVNGSVQLMQVADAIDASVSNGAIHIIDAGGGVTASTSNGGIHLNRVLGDIEVETKNGEVYIREAAGRVKADTLNGTIEVYSGTIGGDWDIVGLVGDVKLQLPIDGSYEMNGSVTFGQIRIDPSLPLASVRKTVRGVVGGGEHRIYVNANSSIAIAPFVR